MPGLPQLRFLFGKHEKHLELTPVVLKKGRYSQDLEGRWG
jgi:hypothetical protein